MLNWRVVSQFSIFESCLICGEQKGVEMHHVKHLRKEGDKHTGFIWVMSKMNRKQIPVCKSCHNNTHAGKYDGISLKYLQKTHYK